MKGLKFRVWDKQRGVMMGFEEALAYLTQLALKEVVRGESKKYEAEMWTGEHDSDGAEIYKGDRLAGEEEESGVVYWDSDKCAFMIDFTYPDKYNEEFLFVMDLNYFKVIGNIHEGVS